MLPKKRTVGPGRLFKDVCPKPPAKDLKEAEPAAIVQELQPPPVSGMTQMNIQQSLGTLTTKNVNSDRDTKTCERIRARALLCQECTNSRKPRQNPRFLHCQAY